MLLSFTGINEECEATSNDAVISFQIRNGVVKVIDPKVQNIHEQYGSSFIEEQETAKDFAERIMTSMSMVFFIETAPWATPEVIQNWSSKVFKDTLV